MTRYARSGSSQKHKKMPGDSTPWEEFSNLNKKDRLSEQKFKGGKITKQTVPKDRFKKFKTGSEEWKNVNNKNEMKRLRKHKNVPNVAVYKITTENSEVLAQKSDQTTLSAKVKNENSVGEMACNRKDSDCEMVTSAKKLIADAHIICNDEVPRTNPLPNYSEVKKQNSKRKLVNAKKELQSLSDEPTAECNSKNQIMSKRKTKKLRKKHLELDKNYLSSQNVKNSNIGNQTAQVKFQIRANSLENQVLNDEEKVENFQTTSISENELAAQKSDVKKGKKKRKLENAKRQLQKASTEPSIEDLSNKQIKKEQKKKTKLLKKQLKHSDTHPESKNSMKSNKMENLDAQIVKKCTNDEKTINNKQNKKPTFLESVQRKRAKNGILLLPQKMERKLYMIKKSLREKGLPGETIKLIIRKERRKEELKFRKTFSSKTCFNCRQWGHIFSECPSITSSSEQGTGICFKCGSTEHTSFKCNLQISGFPFSKCFICKEQGHISRDCPQNKHGVYPKGGKCNLCGNINHLKKDCPSLKKIKNEELFTVHTIAEGTSIDAEIIEESKEIKTKRAKIVKF